MFFQVDTNEKFLYTHIFTHLYEHTHTNIHTHTYIYIYIYNSILQLSIYIYIYIYMESSTYFPYLVPYQIVSIAIRLWGLYHHHHHIVLAARISLTLSRHSSLSFIALGRSSGQQPVSSHSCWMYVRAGRPVFARPCVGIHKSTSLMSSSLPPQQCPACLVRLTWIVFVIGGRWPYSWCLVGCCCQDLFRIARSILV